MRIGKNTNDPNFPYSIIDGWGGKVYCTLDDLEDLAFEIERILKEERAKIQISVKPSQIKTDWFD